MTPEGMRTLPDSRGLPGPAVENERGDARYEWFTSCHGRNCWAVEGMSFNSLFARGHVSIRSNINDDAWKRAVEIETVEVGSKRDFRVTWKSRICGQAAK